MILQKLKMPLLALLLPLFLLGFTANAYAYDADHYAFDNYTSTDGGSIKTTDSSYWGKAYTGPNWMGYTAWALDDRAASDAWTWAKGDTIWAFYGHGRAGGILFKDAGGNTSEIVAESNGNANGTWGNRGPRYYLSLYTDTDISKVAFMYFSGCETANNDSWDGNLVDYADWKGVDSAVGFTGLVLAPQWTNYQYPEYINYFNQQLWARLDQGDAIKIAFDRAGSAYYAKYGSYQGTNTYRANGAGQGSFVNAYGVVLTPAKPGY